MARTTGMDHNLTRQAEETGEGQANQSYSLAQGDIGQFRQNENKITEGKDVAANPWMNPEYLAAVSRLRAGSLHGQADNADQKLRALNARTGGMNSTATIGGISKNLGDTERLSNELGAEQKAGDYNKNVNYQLGAAGLPLEAARAESPLYGTAAGLVGSTNHDLTEYGKLQLQRQYQLQDMAIKAAMTAASAGTSAATGGAGVGGFGEG